MLPIKWFPRSHDPNSLKRTVKKKEESIKDTNLALLSVRSASVDSNIQSVP